MSDPLLSCVVCVSSLTGTKRGTGFVISNSGYIATCAHVVQERLEQRSGNPYNEVVSIRFHAGREERTATVVHWIPSDEGDIALLRIEGKLPVGVRPLQIGSAEMTKGHEIYTFGYPSGTRDIHGVHGYGKVYGIVTTEKDAEQKFLQLQSEEIKAGFSGAPVWDAVRGEVIGMITQLVHRDEHGQTPGIFAVTADRLQKAFDSIGVNISISSPSPYVGARHFYEGEAPLFFGFDKICVRLIDRLQYLQRIEQQPRLLALLGPARSGKSSLIQAGLLPMLGSDAVPGSKGWGAVCVQLGAEPYTHLAAQGLPTPERGLIQSIHHWHLAHPQWKRLLLVLDQFEEMLVQCPQETLNSFIFHLEECLAENLATIILVMRHDTYHLLAQHHALITYVEKSLVNLIPPQDHQTLLTMITGPAQRMGITLEHGLAETCVEDALRANAQHNHEGTDAPIPIFTAYENFLKALCEQRKSDTITYDDYVTLPSLVEGLDGWAECLYQTFDPEKQQHIRSLFMRLIVPGNGDQYAVRSHDEIPLLEICRNEDDVCLARSLAKNGLLLISYDVQKRREMVKIALPTLPFEWQRLHGWWNEERRFHLWRQALHHRIHTSHTDELEDGTDVLWGSDLKEAELWLGRRESDLEDQECQYIQESSQLHQQEILQHRDEKVQEEQRVLTRARQLAANAQRARQEATGITKSVLLAAEALQYESCSEAYQALHESIALLPKLIGSLTLGDAVQRVAFSTDNSYLLVASRNGTVWRQGMSGGSLFSDPLVTKGILRDAIFNSTGNWIASLDEDGLVKIWETKTRIMVTTFRQEHARYISFHPKIPSILAVVSHDGVLMLWQIAIDRTYQVRWKQSMGMLNGLTWNISGQVLATAGQDGTVCIWDSESGQKVGTFEHGGVVTMIAFSPDGTVIASAGSDATVKLWQWSAQPKRGRKVLPIALFPHQEAVQNIAFCPYRDDLLATSSNQIVSLWDLSKKVLYRQWTCSAQIYALTLNDSFIATGCADKTARLWEITSGQEFLRLTHEHAVRSVALSPNGRSIVTGSDDGTVRVWETLRGDQVTRISHPGGATVAAFTATPGGTPYLLATAGAEGDIQLSHFTESGVRFGTRLKHSGHVQNMLFSSDGRFLISVGENATVIIWAMPSGEKTVTLKQEISIDTLAVSQDSRFLAYADKDGTVTVCKLINGETKASLTHSRTVRTMTFIPDADMIVTAVIMVLYVSGSSIIHQNQSIG
jgi:WD40 repeat protein